MGKSVPCLRQLQAAEKSLHCNQFRSVPVPTGDDTHFMARILGIDPGSRVTGFGVIETGGRKPVYIASGCVRSDDDDLARRLKTIFEGLCAVITEHRPDEAVIENVFVKRNIESALKLGQARGAAICAALAGGVTVHEYTPKAIKQAVVGSGGADKVQVQHMVKIILSLPGAVAEDQADALAAAICHAHTLGGVACPSGRGGRP